MNTIELQVEMVRHNDTQEKLAKALGISKTRANAKINAKDGAEFTRAEIMIIKTRYQLTADRLDEIFFD